MRYIAMGEAGRLLDSCISRVEALWGRGGWVGRELDALLAFGDPGLVGVGSGWLAGQAGRKDPILLPTTGAALT